MVEPDAKLSTGCPNKIDIDGWHQQLCDYAVSADYGDAIANSKSLGIRRMKERGAPEHEYCVAWILHADGKTRYMRIERFPEGYARATAIRRSHSQASLESLKKCPAEDLVFTADLWPICDRKLESVDIRNANITLLDLAIAARTVRAHNDEYKILKGQCYWYSDMIMRVLEKACGFSVDRSSSEDLEAAWVELQPKINGGTWNGIPVHHRKEAHVEVLASEFLEERKRIDAEVQQSRRQREARDEAIRERGMEEGIEKGREEGIEKGREEERARSAEIQQQMQAKIDALERANKRK